MAIGRRPVTEDVISDISSLRAGAWEAPIEVDDRLRAGGRRVALRDRRRERSASPGQAHGQYQGRIAADVILGKDARLTQDGSRSPRVIFTDPQVAAVGYTLAAAQAGLNVVPSAST